MNNYSARLLSAYILLAVAASSPSIHALSKKESEEAGALLFRDNQLVRLTTDRTLHQWLGSAHARQSEIGSPDLKSAGGKIGEGPLEGPVTVEQVPLASGDRLLLCTNGLTDFVKEREIAEALTSRRHPREQCQELIDLALAAGSADDITVVVADYRLRARPE